MIPCNHALLSLLFVLVFVSAGIQATPAQCSETLSHPDHGPDDICTADVLSHPEAKFPNRFPFKVSSKPLIRLKRAKIAVHGNRSLVPSKPSKDPNSALYHKATAFLTKLSQDSLLKTAFSDGNYEQTVDDFFATIFHDEHQQSELKDLFKAIDRQHATLKDALADLTVDQIADLYDRVVSGDIPLQTLILSRMLKAADRTDLSHLVRSLAICRYHKTGEIPEIVRHRLRLATGEHDLKHSESENSLASASSFSTSSSSDGDVVLPEDGFCRLPEIFGQLPAKICKHDLLWLVLKSGQRDCLYNPEVIRSLLWSGVQFSFDEFLQVIDIPTESLLNILPLLRKHNHRRPYGVLLRYLPALTNRVDLVTELLRLPDVRSEILSKPQMFAYQCLSWPLLFPVAIQTGLMASIVNVPLSWLIAKKLVVHGTMLHFVCRSGNPVLITSVLSVPEVIAGVKNRDYHLAISYLTNVHQVCRYVPVRYLKILIESDPVAFLHKLSAALHVETDPSIQQLAASDPVMFTDTICSIIEAHRHWFAAIERLVTNIELFKRSRCEITTSTLSRPGSGSEIFEVAPIPSNFEANFSDAKRSLLKVSSKSLIKFELPKIVSLDKVKAFFSELRCDSLLKKAFEEQGTEDFFTDDGV